MFYDKMDVEYHVNQFLDVISIPHSHCLLFFLFNFLFFCFVLFCFVVFY